MQPLLESYEQAACFDEYADRNGLPRRHYAGLAATLRSIEWSDLRAREQRVNAVLLQRGVTFTVYADSQGTERIMPFDLIPRIIPGNEWSRLSRGIAQRVRALNAFLADVYHDQRILREGVVPCDLVYSSKFFCREMIGVRLFRNIYIHVSGIDLIRGSDGTYYVLEDNLRSPSGISYVLENRDVLKRSFPKLFETLPAAAGRRLSAPPARRASQRRAGIDGSDHRAAHAGHLQRGLLRAHVARAPHGRRAGRGQRSRRARQRRLYENDARACSASTSSTGVSTTTSSTRSTSGPTRPLVSRD